jgi:hypothetical protein
MLFSGGGQMLCIASDGSFALERGSPVAGCRTEQCGMPEDDSLFSCSAPSSGCVDIMLSSVAIASTGRKYHISVQQVAGTLYQSDFILAWEIASPRIEASSHVSHWKMVQARSLRATVLLI